jgi:hypothetical protein
MILAAAGQLPTAGLPSGLTLSATAHWTGPWRLTFSVPAEIHDAPDDFDQHVELTLDLVLVGRSNRELHGVFLHPLK